MTITADTRLRELEAAREFAAMRGQFIAGGDFFKGENALQSISDLNARFTTWAVDDMLKGLMNLYRVALTREKYVYNVHKDNDKVALIHIPSPSRKAKAFALLLAGGGYGAVCTMVEALPVAARLNELGVDCFCLNYTVHSHAINGMGLMPKPIDDVAASIMYIDAHSDIFNLSSDSYMVFGFSAGGHLCSVWGLAGVGAAAYGISPALMFAPTYPLITMDTIPDGDMKRNIMNDMFGDGHTPDKAYMYDASRSMTANYPKTFITRSLDDDTINNANADSYIAALERNSIPYQLKQGEAGGHGFGLGTHTDVFGWVDEAVAFAGVLI